jgi:hypothetical protein
VGTSYPAAPLGYRLEIAPGADLTADPDTYTWQDITRDLHLVDPIDRTFGADDEASETNSGLTFTLKNPHGRYTQGNPASDLWPYLDVNLPVRFSINLGDGFGWRQRCVSYLASIEDEWPDATPNRCLAKVECGGRFRWMGQGRALVSAIRRDIQQPVTGKVAYWPLEGGSDTVAPQSGLPGGTPMVSVGTAPPKYGDRTGASGSQPVVAMQTESILRGDTGQPVATSTGWALGFMLNVDQLPATEVILANVWTFGGTITDVDIALNPGTTHDESIYIKAYGAGGVGGDLVGATLYNDDIEKNWLWVEVRMIQNGADIDWQILYVKWFVDENGLASGANYTDSGTIAGRTLGKINNVQLAPNGTLANVAMGHVVVWDGAANLPLQTMWADFMAWAGESATQRISGMCSEADIPNTCPDNSLVYMGPQVVGTVLDNLRNASKTDHGILDDSQGDVTYRCLGDLYNLATSLTIDGARRQLCMPFAPVRDDQKRRNSVTAKRPSGDGVTYEDAADVAAWGLFDSDLSVNTSIEGALLGHAQREVAIGKASLKRYPTVTVDLLRTPELARDWLACELGDRISIINPPRQHTRDAIDLQIVGGKETFGPGRRRWVASINCGPYAPYRAFVREGSDNLGRRAAASSTLAADYAPGATSLSVATASGALWTTAAGQFPMDIEVSGIRLICTGISGAASPQTFTVQWPADGPRKRLPSGASVDLWHPGLRALY